MEIVYDERGLVPVIVGTGVGSDVAKRVASPLWGGLISLTILTLAVIPAFYVIWRGYQLRRAPADGDPPETPPATEGKTSGGTPKRRSSCCLLCLLG